MPFFKTIAAWILCTAAAFGQLIEGGELFGLKTSLDHQTGGSYGPLASWQSRRDASPRQSLGCEVYSNDPANVPLDALAAAMGQSEEVATFYTEGYSFLTGPCPPLEQIEQLRRPGKQLIYDGRSIADQKLLPSPARLAKIQELVCGLPFDGLVVLVKDENDDYAGLSSAYYRTFSSDTLDAAKLDKTLAPLASARFGGMKLWAAVVPCVLGGNAGLSLKPIGWFDDWSGVLRNIAVSCRAYRNAGIVGLFIDDEDYASKWAAWPGDRTLIEYQAQARLRGRQVGRIVKAEGLRALHLCPQIWSQPQSPWFAGFELQKPFFDGMAEGME